jgi:hypothetical protein
MDSKQGLNLGGSHSGAAASNMQRFESSARGANNNLLQMASTLQSRILPTLSSAEQMLARLGSRAKNVFSGMGGGGSSNTVMAQPSFSNTGNNTTPGGPTPPSGGGGGGGGGTAQPAGNQPRGNTVFQQPANTAGTIAAAAVTAGGIAMPSVDEAFRMQLYTARGGLVLGGAYGRAGGTYNGVGQPISGSGASSYNDTRDLLNRMAKSGTVKDEFDPARSLQVMRQSGLYGGSSANAAQLAMGAAQMSNLTPGIGVEGAMQAQGAVQRGRSVNMLRAVGIRIRDDQGNMKPLPQIIDELWMKLEREKRKNGGSGSTLRDVQISLQPGNALATMLDNLFGNDPYLRAQVEDGLLFKAQSGGMSMSDPRAAKKMEQLGFTTFAAKMQSQRTAQAAEFISQTAPAMADAKGRADQILSYISGFFTEVEKFTGLISVLGGTKGFFETLGGGGKGGLGGFFASLIPNPVASAITGLFKADGGPVEEQRPYIVGERGPELFMPKTDGVIIPNDELKNYPFRHAGGAVKGKKGHIDLNDKSSNEDFAKAMLLHLNAPMTKDAIEALKIWQNFEGGHFQNSAKYNPLNTTYDKYSNKSMNSVGVKIYDSWDDGLHATIETLTGAKAGARGYSDIVKALQGGANKEEILAAINNSAWVTGKTGQNPYKFSKNQSASDFSGFSGMEPKDGGLLSGSTSNSSLAKLVENFWDSSKKMQQQAAAQGAQTTNNYSMGGVSIKVDGGSGAIGIAEALKKILSDKDLFKQAMGS